MRLQNNSWLDLSKLRVLSVLLKKDHKEQLMSFIRMWHKELMIYIMKR